MKLELSTVWGRAADWFRPTVLNLRCCSVRAGKWLALRDQVLASADETRIRFAVRWPVFASPRRVVHIRLAVLPAREGAPQNNRPDSGAQPGQAVELKSPEDYQARQSATGRITRVQVRFRIPLLKGCEAVQLTIRDGRARRLVGRQRFTVIDETRAQWLRLETLRAEKQQLWIRSGDHSYPGELVADTSDGVAAQFTIPNSELTELLPACQTSITWTLLAGRKRTVLGTQRLTLGPAPVSVKTEPIPLRNPSLFPGPGPYCLVATVAGRDVAAHSFQILTRREWLQQLKVQRIDLLTETLDGQLKLEQSGALRWGQHSAFRVCVWLQAVVPAPNTPLKFLARLAQGQTVLRTEEFCVRLNQPAQRVWLQRFGLEELGTLWQGKHVRLNLSIVLGEQAKAERPLIILPVQTLTNFEGQLNRSHQELPLDEAAYQQILNQLAGKPAERAEHLRLRRLLCSLGLSSVWPQEFHPLDGSNSSANAPAPGRESPPPRDGRAPP